MTGADTVSVAALDSGPAPDASRVFKVADGENLVVDIFYPDGHTPGDSRPAVAFFHGGGWTSGGPFNHHPHCRYFARRGLVALSFSYRYAKSGTSLAETVSDARSAIRWVRAEADDLGVNPNRVLAAGESSGGHLAACAAYIDGFDDPSDDLSFSARPDAVVLLNPVMKIPELWWLAFNDATLPLLPITDPAPTAPPDPEDSGLDLAWRLSPLYYLRAEQPPAFFAHGSLDSVVDVDQSIQAHERLRGAKVLSHLFVAEGAQHAFPLTLMGTEEQVAAALALMDDFMGSIGYLSGSATVEPYGQNLLQAPDFSSDAGWSFSGPAQRSGGVLELGDGGVASQSVELTAFAFHPSALDSGRLAVAFTGEGRNSGFVASVHARDDGGSILKTETLPVPSSVQWDAFRETFVLPEGTRSLELHLEKSGSGTAQVDDVALRVLTQGSPESFKAWRQLYFSPQEQQDPGLSGPGGRGGAGEGDNLYKYALGLSRNGDGFGTRALPGLQGGLALDFPRNPLRTDVTLRVVGTTDLGELSAGGGEVLYDSATDSRPNALFERQRVEYAPVGGGGFVRLLVRYTDGS